MYKMLPILITIIFYPLYSMDKASGFNDITLPDFHPGLGAMTKQCGLLGGMRLSGPYGPKELSQDPQWRHSSFESRSDKTDYMTIAENDCQYPYNAIAAFIQWCYPSLIGNTLKANTENDGSIGSLAMLLNSALEADINTATTCLGYLLSWLSNCYVLDLPDFDALQQTLQTELGKKLPKGINLNCFIEIIFNAIKLERVNRPLYYMEETVKQTFLSYLVDVSKDKAQLTGIYNSVGLLSADPKEYPLTVEAFATAKDKMAPGTPTFDEAVHFLALYNKFGNRPDCVSAHCHNPFSPDGMSFVNIHIENMHENPPCLDILQRQGHNLENTYTPFFFSGPWLQIHDFNREKVLSIGEPELTTLLVRHVLSFIKGEWSTSDFSHFIESLFQGVYPGKPLSDILRNMRQHPMGKIFIQHYLAPNYFPTVNEPQFKDALSSVLDAAYFGEMAQSNHSNKYQLLCFYGKHLPLLEEISQNPNHPDYNKVFRDALHEQHPLVLAVRNKQMPTINLVTDNGIRPFWKVGPKANLHDRFMLLNALETPEVLSFLLKHNPEILNFNDELDIFRVLKATTPEAFDILVIFFTENYNFKLEDFLRIDCKEALDQPCTLDRVNFLDHLLIDNLGYRDEDSTRTKQLIKHINPKHKVSPQALTHLISQVNCQRHSNERLIDILHYTDHDIIQQSLEGIKFDVIYSDCHKGKNEPLYPYFTDTIWINFVREGLDTPMDRFTWLALNEMFTHLSEMSESLKMQLKALFSEEKYKEKSFLLGLFNPNLFQQNDVDNWKIRYNEFKEQAQHDHDMVEHVAKLNEQFEALRTLSP